MSALRSVLILMLASLAGCGGSGPGGVIPAPLTAPDFLGPYHNLGINEDEAWFGLGAADGMGSFTASETRNQGGVVSTTPIIANFSVDPDGAMTWRRLGVTVSSYGTMTADGGLAALDADGLRVLLEPSGATSREQLTGTFHFVSFGLTLAGVASSDIGTMTFDGLGGVVATLDVQNTEGTVITDLGSISGVYDVAADGKLTMNFGALALEGALGLGGEFAALAGGANATEGSSLLLLVRQQAGTGHAGLVQGRYGVAGHQFDPLPVFGTPEIRAAFDGHGDGSGSYRNLVAPLLGPPTAAGPATYTVAADGRFDLTLPLLRNWRGAVTASGHVAILGGGIMATQDPAILVLVRQRDVAGPGEIAPDPFDSGDVADIVDTSGGIVTFRQEAHALVETRRLRAESTSVIGNTTHPVLRFDLRGLPPGADVAQATLITVQDSIEGDPFTSGFVVVDHADLGPFLDESDFGAAPRPGGFMFGTLSDHATPGERTIDVTEQVRLDLADGRTSSDFQFRLVNAGLTVAAVIFDDHTEDGPTPGSRTRLLITLQ